MSTSEFREHYCYHVAPSGCQVFLSILTRPGPVLICVHGGGIVVGSRDWKIPEEILDSWPGAVIDIDYRLLVPSSGHDIRADMRALLFYITDDSFPLSPEQRHQLFFIGFSGGGYPIRLASVLAAEESQAPHPRFGVLGVVSVSGMGGDMLLDYWLSERRPGTFHEDAQNEHRDNVDTLDPGARRSLIKNAEEFWNCEECSATTCDPPGGRWVIWDYLHATGSLNDAISGQRGLSERLGALSYEDRAASIPLQHRDVYPQLFFEAHPDLVPPTLLIHGDCDEVVPVLESINTYQQLSPGKAELRLISGGDHGLRDDASKDIYRYSVRWMLSKVTEGCSMFDA